MTVSLVFIGGALGSVLRYLTDRLIQSRHRITFPFGTLAVNLAGCLILGIVAGGVAKAGWSPHLQSLLGTGLCGGLTTFSTFAVETVQLGRTGRPARAGGYGALSVGAGIGLAALGWAVV